MRKPYSEYRQSGIPWLGQVPCHWEVARLKWSSEDITNGVWGDEPDGENDISCIRVADFDRHRLEVRTTEPTIRAVEPSQRTGRELHAGDLLIEKSGGGDKQIVGAVVHYSHCLPAVSSNFIGRITIRKNDDPKFWTYVHAMLYAGRLTYPAIKQTTGIQNLDTNAYFNTEVGFPPHDEQRAIAAFLDRETARINQLVAKHELLIERLKEYRVAVITRAITKGLPPDAAYAAGLDPEPRLKPSGIEWIGDIPEHWTTVPVKHVATYSTSTVDKKVQGDEIKVRLCNYTDVYYRDRINAEGEYMEATASSNEHSKFKLLVGDTVITKDSEDWRDIAVPALVEKTANDFVCGYHLGIIRPSPEVNHAFMFWAIKSTATNQQMQVASSGVNTVRFTQPSSQKRSHNNSSSRRTTGNRRLPRPKNRTNRQTLGTRRNRN